MSANTVPPAYFDARLQTAVVALRYDFVARTGWLDQLPGCCTDMTGVIELFQRIHPEVERIETLAGGVPDTLYVRQGRRWTARLRHGVGA